MSNPPSYEIDYRRDIKPNYIKVSQRIEPHCKCWNEALVDSLFPSHYARTIKRILLGDGEEIETSKDQKLEGVLGSYLRILAKRGHQLLMFDPHAPKSLEGQESKGWVAQTIEVAPGEVDAGTTEKEASSRSILARKALKRKLIRPEMDERPMVVSPSIADLDSTLEERVVTATSPTHGKMSTIPLSPRHDVPLNPSSSLAKAQPTPSATHAETPAIPISKVVKIPTSLEVGADLEAGQFS
ncbi:hypothetical protein ACFE04_027588 [Oxalis oulophora]